VIAIDCSQAVREREVINDPRPQFIWHIDLLWRQAGHFPKFE
jgi:hypothetical protein